MSGSSIEPRSAVTLRGAAITNPGMTVGQSRVGHGWIAGEGTAAPGSLPICFPAPIWEAFREFAAEAHSAPPLVPR